MVFCSNCGMQLNDGARFCSNCGQPIDFVQPQDNRLVPPPFSQTMNQQYQTPPQQVYIIHRKSKGLALILCAFFGGIGIHEFYLRNYISGTLYLLFCWTLIPLLFSILDFFVILLTPESIFHEMYDK